MNRAARQGRRAGVAPTAAAKSAKPNVVIFQGDRIISQFVDGPYWLTSITVVNLETHATDFDVLFFEDDGSDFNAPVVGLSGQSQRQQIAS